MDMNLLLEFIKTVGVPVALLVLILWYIGKRLTPRMMGQIDKDREILVQQLKYERETFEKTTQQNIEAFRCMMKELRDADLATRQIDRQVFQDVITRVCEATEIATKETANATAQLAKDVCSELKACTTIVQDCKGRKGN